MSSTFEQIIEGGAAEAMVSESLAAKPKDLLGCSGRAGVPAYLLEPLACLQGAGRLV